MHVVRCAALAAVVALTAAASAAQPAAPVPEAQPPMFRNGVGLVRVPVVVCDDAGRFVDDVPAAAFDVFENGRRMPLVDVEIVQRGSAGRPYAPREILVVVDDLAIRPQVMPLAARAAHDLLDRFDPRDRVALVNTSTMPDLRIDFTTSRAVLDRAVDRLRGQQDAGHAFGWQRARQGLAVLRSVLEQLRAEGDGSRRVMLVLLSEGYDVDAVAQRGMVDLDILRDVRAVVGLAAQANVTIHAIDPAGLQVDASPFRPTGVRPVGPAARMRRSGVSSSLAAIADQSALAALAHDTGGRLTRWTNDPLANVPAMLADADDYYLLTYEMPEATARDRRGQAPVARQIDVRVRRPDLDVRARQAYVHPAALAEADGR